MAEDYKTRFECAEGLIKKLVTEINEKNTIIAVMQAENRQLKEETEIRYNPYHDPTNGRFTSPNGAYGGVLYVGQGQKGKGTYVFDRDTDSEYEDYKKSKLFKHEQDIYSKKYTTADEYKNAIAEKYNGITSVDKIKTVKDVENFINYDVQSQSYGSTRLDDGITKGFQSTWRKNMGAVDDVVVSDAGFSDGTTKLTIPKNSKHIYEASFNKLKENNINVGEWFDNQTYLLLKKKGVRTNKWLEGFKN